ncbi:extracellular solute-binding protein [Nitrospina watsonii]|uniref:ABC-type oligopeptide/dipeptide transport system, periplasmic binding component n=1 Tax=Nitrospina watsonii TaxID=1323948 RepID=A0ABM9HEH0_9BACT|nr:extracellular solute-binding protein [Nitrospina watsonii]CAI2718485.1 Putative ABC-type oligopeptide/dipeptide transport system, periplasmic binding component [Nitrospina watsonii]
MSPHQPNSTSSRTKTGPASPHFSAFFLLWLGLLLAAPGAALSQPQHGLSLYGPEGLKYKAGQTYDYAYPKAPKGGHLVLSGEGAFTKLNPASLKGVPATGINLVFQTPMDSSADDDEPFSQYGSLVEKVELADDRMSMIYHIYKEAKFSDGQPVTANDFVFSFELLEDPQYHPFYKQYFKDITKAEKLDAHRVKYTFAIFNQELPLITGQMLIFPKHVYGQPGKQFGEDFDDIAVGSGPYVVERYEYGKFITLKRNPDWWGKDLPKNRGRYNFDRLTWKIYLDPVARREAFKGGEFDAHLIGSSRDWALDYKGDFVSKGYYLREEVPHQRVAGMQGFVMNMRNDIFKSRRVRAAVAMVYDFDWANKNLFYGQYTRNDCYFDNNPEMKPDGLPQGRVLELLLKLRKKHGAEYVPKTVFTKPVGAPGQGAPFEKSVALANKLLDAEGWKLGPDGVRVKNGKPLRWKVHLASPGFERIVEPYKNSLKKIGADMSFQVVQVAQYEQILRDFKFDMVVMGYPQSRSPGNEQRSMWSSEAADMPGTRNYAGIRNPAIDELIEQLVEANTRKELVDHIQALDRILTHQFYMVPHWYMGADRFVYWNKFSRPAINPSQSAILNNMIEWWWWDEAKAQKLKAARQAGVPVN